MQAKVQDAPTQVKRVEAWLIGNARQEASHRRDSFNSLMFGNVDLSNLSQSDKDAAEMYLFG